MSGEARIRVLPDLLVNKIAAGEVVERPASVVKELVENAIDAGATRIHVLLEDGGRQLIRVTDDGGGMSQADLRLAVMPHATSKVVCEDDLYAIRTMGFRGEALASIAAVSKLRIVSRVPAAVEGYEIRAAGDVIEPCQAAGAPEGTTVEVRDLFFNVPARRKFLRAAPTEVGHVSDVFARAALAYPAIGFELTINKRTAHNLPACNSRLERIARFYGPELSTALMSIQREERGVRLDAYAAPPAQSRATAQWQYVFVNGRYVRDRFIGHAIKEAYRGLMEPNRHGVVFLFLDVDPHDVDVNVHPTKIEVRWADSSLIHSQVLSALREAFQRCELAPRLRTDRAASTLSEEEQDRLRRELADVLKGAAPVNAPPIVGHGSASRAPWGSPSPMNLAEQERIWRSLYGRAEENAETQKSRNAETTPLSSPLGNGGGEESQTGHWPLATGHSSGGTGHWPLGTGHLAPGPRAVQMHNLYLVAETDEGIVIVDQHALHERIMYEQLKERIAGGALESQRLLLPEVLRVTPEQAALIEAHADVFARLGIELSPFGRDSMAVQAFPVILKDTDVVPFLRDLLDRLAHEDAAQKGAASIAAATPEVVIHKVLDLMACKAAVKAGDPLTDEEIHDLLRQRHLVEKSTSCPHGRPTMLRLTKADLNRQFKRT